MNKFSVKKKRTVTPSNNAIVEFQWKHEEMWLFKLWGSGLAFQEITSFILCYTVKLTYISKIPKYSKQVHFIYLLKCMPAISLLQ